MRSPSRAILAEPLSKRHTPPMEKLALTIQEAAQLSSLGQTSIYKAIRDGHLKCHKYGSRSIITRVDLMSFLDSLPVETKKAREP
jgi:excisionase family DNA binding protein